MVPENTYALADATYALQIVYFASNILQSGFSMMTEVRAGQLIKAPPLMLVTLSGIRTERRESHHPKAKLPMLSTLSGIVTEIRESQYSKAALPMLVTFPTEPYQDDHNPSSLPSR